MKNLIIVTALILMPLFTTVGVATTDFTVNSTQQSIIGEVIENDNTFSIKTTLQVAGSDATATTNNENNPIDITTADPLVNANNISRGNYVYLIQLEEKSASSAPADSKWLVRVFLNDTQVGSNVYIGNITPDNTSIEGVRIRVNLGNSFSGGVIQTVISRVR